MSQDLDQLSDEKLDALAAELLGWLLVTAPSWGYPEGEPSWVYENEVVARVSNWHPADEGYEHQAMMVARKLREASQRIRWDFEDALLEMVPTKSSTTLPWLLWEANFGRTIILAALKAKGVGDGRTTHS